MAAPEAALCFLEEGRGRRGVFPTPVYAGVFVELTGCL